ncbi:MAG: GNAT family N-acetyltransferase [Candidatus Devosia phytovorans]|uniref:GNAT family N-acetyltransferase n=1 Tax=Candidatus Devosia phytovorans TaxID=3121372 RepID=A0AAJ5VWZ4_9HYPH|nr:GNAT family N-acetyltransferase [Devosia sp.]WEK05611.1 MAG: GNAT family N-acetyltransferase [Devosia sp.]
MSLICAQETGLSAEEYIACVGQSKLGPTRPLGNTERVQAMLDSSNLTITARDEAGRLVGRFRGMTDWNWVCYCADMAVVETSQGQGIGKTMMDKASEILGPGVSIVLLALPGAEGFYQKIGLTQTQAGFYRDRTHRT